MFTVKVDLSSVIDNSNGHQMYILLVDPCKMKVVFEFKKWIQFLFSIDFCIRLVYEDAVIHELEDINILSLLRSVKIEQSVPPTWEDKVHDLLAEKTKKFNEMLNNGIFKTLIDKSNTNLRSEDLTDVECSNPQINSSGLSTNGLVNETLDKSWRNVAKDKFCSENESQNIVSPHEKKVFCQDIEKDKDIQYCSVSPSEHGFPIANNKNLNSGWKKNESNENFDIKRRNIAYAEINSDLSTPYKTNKVSEVACTQDLTNSDLTKTLNKQLFADNPPNGEIHIVKEQLKTQSKKLPEVCSQYKSKNFIKPFCIGNLLNEMRTESFCKADQNDTINENTGPLISLSEFVDDKKMLFQNENNSSTNHITFEKRIRKRIRKHKSKRKNTDCELNNITVSSPVSFPIFSKSSNHRSLNSGQKPKHIRFDLDVDEVDLDHSDNEMKNNTSCQEYNEIKNSSNDCEDSKRLNAINVEELRNMIQEKRKALELNCNKEENTDKDSNCSDLYSPDVYCVNERKVMENQFFEVQNSLQVVEEENQQNMLESEFPKTIFDISNNSRKKYSNPFVFNRFN